MKTKDGMRYKDKITGFIGTVTGHAQYITGCKQTLLVPKWTPGVQEKSRWYDDDRLVECKKKFRVKVKSTRRGSDMSPPLDSEGDDEAAADERN